MSDIESTIERHTDKACFHIRHSTTIAGNTFYVYHYQEDHPDETRLGVLREDANIKFQLTEGDLAQDER